MKSKLVTFVLSISAAFVLWAYVVTVVSPESEGMFYNVPVTLGGQSILEERDLMIVSDVSGLKVDLKLSGYRSELNKLGSGNIIVLADLAQIREPGEHRLNLNVSYPSGVETGSVDVVEKHPQQITVTVVETAKKEIPVKVNFTGSAPSGYTADKQNPQLDHATVTILGPKAVVDVIDHAAITVDLRGQRDTLVETFKHTLCDAEGIAVQDVHHVTANISEITATVRISKLVEVPLRVHLIPGGGLTADMVKVTLSRDTIMISGSEAVIDEIRELVLGTIDLSQLTEDASMMLEVKLPEDVQNVTGITTVTVTLDLPEMETRIFNLSNFQAVHVPEGMHVTYLTEQLSVQIRGYAANLDKLEALLREDPTAVVVEVDFTGAQMGLGTYRCTVLITGVEGVGTVGAEHTVGAHLQQAESVPETES